MINLDHTSQRDNVTRVTRVTFIEAISSWPVPAHLRPAIVRNHVLITCARLGVMRARVSCGRLGSWARTG